jgi:hypothetical protein
MKSLEECFRVLGLPVWANAEEVAAAFRRLAKEHHPDVNPTRDGPRRFVEVAKAYRILREALRVRRSESRWGRCPRCDRYADLYAGLDGAEGCADCLLGRTRRSRFLPLPVVVVAKHLAVFGLYVASVVFLILYLQTGQWDWAATSLICVVTGMTVLAIDVLLLAWPEAAARRARSQRAAAGSREAR